MPYKDIERKRAKDRELYQRYKEKRAIYGAEYYRKNRDRLLAGRRERYAKDPTGIIQQTRSYRVAHFEEYSFGLREKSRHLRMEVLLAYGDRCNCLGCDEWRYEFLTIDHIDGGGYAHRKELKGSNIYRWLKRSGYPQGYQILCINCNWAKGMYGYCPHEP